MRYVVAFDISEDRRRYRVVKLLLSVGSRVQKSVFELDDVGEGMLKKILAEVRRVLDVQQDALRVYALCGTCLGKVEALGVGPGKPPRRSEEFVVI